LNLSGSQLQRHHALNAAVVHQESGYKELVVTDHGVVFEGRLKQRMEHVEAGLVGREPRAGFLHAAEGPDGDASIRLAAPGTAPMFEAHQLERSLLHEGFHGVLIAQPIPTGDGVVGVFVQAVFRGMHAGRAALGRHRVTAHWVHLGDDRYAEFWIGFGNRNGGTQAGATAADQHNVVGGDIEHGGESRIIHSPAGGFKPAGVPNSILRMSEGPLKPMWETRRTHGTELPTIAV
jgi:hypothetical protein